MIATLLLRSAFQSYRLTRTRSRWLFAAMALLIIILSPVGTACFAAKKGFRSVRKTTPRRVAIALTDVTLVSMESNAVVNGQTVILRDGIINEVGPTKAVRIPRGAFTVNGAGQYLMPGLADMHVHVFSPDDFLSYLAFGVTTVLDMSGSPSHLRWRRGLAQGKLVGPTLYAAGTTLDGNPPLNPMFWVVERPDDARRAVVEQKRAGYDFIKVYGTINPDVYRAILDEARRQDITVVGHIPRQPDFHEIIEGGQSMIAHGEELLDTYFSEGLDESRIPELVRLLKSSGKTVTPNLVVIPRTMREVEDLKGSVAEPDVDYLSTAAYSEWIPANNRNSGQEDPKGYLEWLMKRHSFLRKLTKALSDGGVPLLAGTDSATVGYPGKSLHQELKEMVKAGLTPFEALRTATRQAGEFMSRSTRLGEKFGVISVGSRADLLLLGKNPLADVSNLNSIRGLAVRGRWFTRETLDDARSRLALANRPGKRGVDRFEELVSKGRLIEAASVLRSLGKKYPNTSSIAQWVLMIKGQSLEQKDLDQSILLRSINAELYPESFSVYNELAAGYFRKRDIPSAEACLRKSLALAPLNGIAVDLKEKTRSG